MEDYGVIEMEQVEEEEDNFDDDDYEDEDEDLEDHEGEEVEELVPPETTSPRVSTSIADALVNVCDGKPVNRDNGGDDGGKELNRGEIDVCPICFQPWTSAGDHRICCLPCGHIYGMSCIEKWLIRSQSSGKCPQCKSSCTLTDIRVLYATRLYVADDEKSHKASSTDFPYTKEGFSGFQQHIFTCMDALQQRMDALEQRVEECDSNLRFLQQRYNELMGQTPENSQ